MKVLKKNNVFEQYSEQKIINAINKSAQRALCELRYADYIKICQEVFQGATENCEFLEEIEDEYVTVEDIHSIVEETLLNLYPKIGYNYQQYRNYKLDFVKMLDEVYLKSQNIRYIGDVSNANTDSAMISTQRSLIYGQLNKNLYQKFFLNKTENQACDEGYIYIHDMKDRLDGVNCMLFDMQNVLKDGFEMGNIWYNEPNSLDTAFDVISDVVLSASSQIYGGFTIPRVDTILSFYAEKSFENYKKEYLSILEEVDYDLYKDVKSESELSEKYAIKRLRRDFDQGFQGWEYKFNTVGSSRGDYPFVSISFGIDTTRFGLMASEIALETRKNGQGKKGLKKPVLFPKLTFLYDENLHGKGKDYEWLFEKGIDCSSKTMYPDWLSLTGEGYIPSIYKKYGQVISLMGCRASLSPWYVKGGINPLDEEDYPIFEGRCNLGAISLHLPMILAKSKQENKEFYETLNYYLEMIRNLHKRTYDYLGEKKASTNPLCFMQGGLLGGVLQAEDKIKPLLKPMTMSFGITALNELQQLYNGKSLVEDSGFALDVMKYINEYTEKIKYEDNILYAVYGVPAESLCGTQVEQFRKKYGVIENVSDKPYMSNSFHCHVTENISPIQKQNLENKFYNYFNGGKIQYCRYNLGYNIEAIRILVRMAMDLGFYEGINLSLSYCEDCGYEQVEMETCPECSSDMITKIDRMNGYLQYSRVHGKSRSNEAKMSEIGDRISM